MAKFILKRLLLFIPTILIISILTFFLSKSAPGDPVARATELDDYSLGKKAYKTLYRQTAENLGLDKPVFYCQLTTAAFPDTLYKITPLSHRNVLVKMIQRYGNWPSISKYNKSIRNFERVFDLLPDSILAHHQATITPSITQLYLNQKEKTLQFHLDKIKKNIASNTAFPESTKGVFDELFEAYSEVLSKPSPEKNWMPALKWHGINNQYHHWLKNIMVGNLGVSLVDGRPVVHKILEAIKWTLLINGIAIFLAFFIAIIIGINAAIWKGTRFDRLSSLFLFMLHSLPSFWLAVLLIIFFTNNQYGMDWFPARGVGIIPAGASFWEIIQIRSSHLTLPVLCLTYPSLAFISRQMRGSMINVLNKDYIRTAYAKGVARKKIIWKHAFRNSLFPIITIFASVFPAAIAGSVVIEKIFSIPGMGRLMLKSIDVQDWPVVFSILILASILTILGILVSDILYASVDPRVKLDKK